MTWPWRTSWAHGRLGLGKMTATKYRAQTVSDQQGHPAEVGAFQVGHPPRGRDLDERAPSAAQVRPAMRAARLAVDQAAAAEDPPPFRFPKVTLPGSPGPKCPGRQTGVDPALTLHLALVAGQGLAVRGHVLLHTTVIWRVP
jgi:hypothetical protein